MEAEPEGWRDRRTHEGLSWGPGVRCGGDVGERGNDKEIVTAEARSPERLGVPASSAVS